jgi:general secretion pathway protein L
MRKQMVLQLSGQWSGAEKSGGNTEDIHASWLLREENRPEGSQFFGSLKDAAIQAVGAHVTVLVPAEEVVLAKASLPAMKGQKLIKAVPYALEEQLADDVEDVHVAIGHRDEEGRLANAVVSRNTIDHWLDQLKAAGLNPDVMSPEVFGVSWIEEADKANWSLVVNASQALLRTGAQSGLAFDAINLIPVLQAGLNVAGDTPPSTLSVVSCSGDLLDDISIQDELTQLCQDHSIKLSIQHTEEPCDVLLARDFDERNAINLLQGDYSRKQQMGRLLRPWRPTLILAAIWLVLQFSMLGVDYAHLSKLDDKQQTEIESLFKQAMPGSRLVKGSEKTLMEQRLESLRSGGSGNGMLGLLARSGEVFKQTSGTHLRSLRFKDNKLDVDMDLPDLQTLDKLKQGLKDAGLNVEIVSASSREGKVESRLSLQGAGK